MASARLVQKKILKFSNFAATSDLHYISPKIPSEYFARILKKTFKGCANRLKIFGNKKNFFRQTFFFVYVTFKDKFVKTSFCNGLQKVIVSVY